MYGPEYFAGRFDYRRAKAMHAGWYEAHLPEANPRRKIDFGSLPVPQFSKE